MRTPSSSVGKLPPRLHVFFGALPSGEGGGPWALPRAPEILSEKLLGRLPRSRFWYDFIRNLSNNPFLGSLPRSLPRSPESDERARGRMEDSGGSWMRPWKPRLGPERQNLSTRSERKPHVIVWKHQMLKNYRHDCMHSSARRCGPH